jgi:ATP-dependent protease ClpP protease subunit
VNIEMRSLGNKKAEIDIYGVIGKKTYWEGDSTVTPQKFREDLKALGDVDEITVNVNSDGGDVFAGKAIATALKQHPAKIYAKIDSLAASMAGVIIVEAADKISIAENAYFMVHEARGFVGGTAKEIRRRADLIESLTTQSIDLYYDRSKKMGKDVSRSTIKQMFIDETFIDANEAVELGFADEITGKVEIAASLEDFSKLSDYEGLPVALQELAGAKPPASQPQLKDGDLMDLETLKAEHPEVLQAIRDEFKAEAVNTPAEEDITQKVDEAVKQERERIAEIHQVAPDAEAAEKAIKDGITAEQFALQVLKANKEKNDDIASQMTGDLEVVPGHKSEEDQPVVQELPNARASVSNLNKAFSGE